MTAPHHELPPGWTWKTMGDIADVVGGGTPRTSDSSNYDGGTIPWLTPADLSGYAAKHIARGARSITQNGLDGSSAKMMPAGTVLFTSRAPIGYVAIASSPICTNQGFKSFVIKDDVLPDYVYWWLKGSKQLAESMASGTTFLELSGAKAKQLPIPVAPPAEQKRIVAEIEKQFSRLDQAVANLNRVKANLKRYKAAVLKAAVEGHLVETEAQLARRAGRTYETGEQLLHQILLSRRSHWSSKRQYTEPATADTTTLPELPEGWTWATWDQISQWVTYGFTRPMPHVDRGVPIVTAKHVVDGRVVLDETHKTPYDNYSALSDKDRPIGGDILITKDGTIGRAAIVPENADFCINQSVAVIWLRSCPIDRRFLLAVIGSELVQKPVREKARGVAIKHLSITDFARLPLPLPPLDEQHRIADEVDRCMSVVREIEIGMGADLARAARLRRSVLRQAFSGSISPRSETSARND